MSAPSMPKSSYSWGWMPRISSACRKTGSSHPKMRDLVRDSSTGPMSRPRKTVGMASRMSGTVMDGGDSWTWGSTAGSTWLSP